MPDLTTPFDRATLALSLISIDSTGLGGIVLRARSGPVRDAYQAMFTQIPLPQTRLHPALSDEALFGGLDLSATLATGRIVQGQGLLARPALLLLAMAERSDSAMAARLTTALDSRMGHCLIAFDEGAEPDEALPNALSERLAFFVDLNPIALGDVTGFPPDEDELTAARLLLPEVTITSELLTQIVTVAAQFGIDSSRAMQFAVRAAKAHAALSGQREVTEDDCTAAVALVYGHRATQFPQADEEQHVEDGSPRGTEAPPDTSDESAQDDDLVLPDELLLDAVRAMLPEDLLARIAAGKARHGKGSGSGAKVKGNRRGRPLPSRVGRLGGTARIDIVATLRAAAPWQTIRRAMAPAKQGLHIRTGDIHVRRFEDQSDRLLIFTVDASGSAALARLSEAKGAVEILLSQAYARRDHVALVSFRGAGAEVLLPPTRSLVQTKRRLAALPGGGGTPLAAGLQTAMELALTARRRGLTPTLALLTDGRANIALDGSANRAQAGEDAQRLARSLRGAGADVIVIDTGNRPDQSLKALSDIMAAPYIALPRADAKRLSKAVTAALDG